MSFSVTHHGIGLTISTGDGQPVRVRTTEQAATCLLHYYGSPHDKGNCRFCREVEKGGD